MSVYSVQKRISIPDLRGMKGPGKMVMLTAYTKPMAQLLDPHCDVLLVGDSLGMVVYGMDNTLNVSLDTMIAHTQAVMRGSRQAAVLLDMPFGSYQESKEQAYRNCARAMAESGAQGLKLEGGAELVETVEFLVARGLPIMPHIGLMPQRVNEMGGFKAQGREEDAAKKWTAIARQFEHAGAFSVLIEGTVEPVARAVAEALSVPLIGIGASPACDGQVLVTEDILGLFPDFTPKFAKRYVEMGKAVSGAAAAYAEEVRSGKFPSLEHCFGVKKQV
ncbi:MAG: 3-methyl-2-oxobutanoate hydroxymethyltransferase [Betaproteobacteria bacterium]